jgi:predicted DNA-binding transcriptional regulator AlpA
MSELPNERATVTIPEFARRFGIARSTAYALAQRDALPVPVIRLGRRMVVSRAIMDRLLAGQPPCIMAGEE